MYVIIRVSDGRYVARAGSTSSYTRRLDHARRFATREAAQADACENERVENVLDILERRHY